MCGHIPLYTVCVCPCRQNVWNQQRQRAAQGAPTATTSSLLTPQEPIFRDPLDLRYAVPPTSPQQPGEQPPEYTPEATTEFMDDVSELENSESTSDSALLVPPLPPPYAPWLLLLINSCFLCFSVSVCHISVWCIISVLSCTLLATEMQSILLHLLLFYLCVQLTEPIVYNTWLYYTSNQYATIDVENLAYMCVYIYIYLYIYLILCVLHSILLDVNLSEQTRFAAT